MSGGVFREMGHPLLRADPHRLAPGRAGNRANLWGARVGYRPPTLAGTSPRLAPWEGDQGVFGINRQGGGTSGTLGSHRCSTGDSRSFGNKLRGAPRPVPSRGCPRVVFLVSGHFRGLNPTFFDPGRRPGAPPPAFRYFPAPRAPFQVPKPTRSAPPPTLALLGEKAAGAGFSRLRPQPPRGGAGRKTGSGSHRGPVPPAPFSGAEGDRLDSAAPTWGENRCGLFPRGPAESPRPLYCPGPGPCFAGPLIGNPQARNRAERDKPAYAPAPRLFSGLTKPPPFGDPWPPLLPTPPRAVPSPPRFSLRRARRRRSAARLGRRLRRAPLGSERKRSSGRSAQWPFRSHGHRPRRERPG